MSVHGKARRELARTLSTSKTSYKQVPVWLIVFCSACCAVAGAQAVPDRESTAGVFGRVLNAQTHEAVRRAGIKIKTSRSQWDAFTDGEGRFRFPSLSPGEYDLIAHRDGYTDRTYKVTQSDFGAKKEFSIELRPTGVISGKAVDGLGQALESAQIQALSLGSLSGKLEVLASADTNDLGEYRLAGLDPGTYRLRATYREGRSSQFDSLPLAMATSYYGGSEKPAEIAVKAGAETTGIDFVLDAIRPLRVRGTLHTETGVMVERANVSIMGQAGEGGHNGDGRDGKFEIADLGPGTYTILAETMNKTAPLFGTATVEVRGEDVNAIELVLRPEPKIDCEIRVEGAVLPDVKLGPIYFMGNSGVSALNMRTGHPDKDRKFTVALIPGEYLVSIDASIKNFVVRSITLDDKPITNWKLHIDKSPETRKLTIVVGAKSNP
jgi:hypothetical protein